MFKIKCQICQADSLDLYTESLRMKSNFSCVVCVGVNEYSYFRDALKSKDKITYFLDKLNTVNLNSKWVDLEIDILNLIKYAESFFNLSENIYCVKLLVSAADYCIKKNNFKHAEQYLLKLVDAYR